MKEVLFIENLTTACCSDRWVDFSVADRVWNGDCYYCSACRARRAEKGRTTRRIAIAFNRDTLRSD